MKRILTILGLGLIMAVGCTEKEHEVAQIVHVRKVVLSESEFHLKAAATVMPTIFADVLPEDASNKTLTWSSSHEDLVDIDPKSGTMTRTKKKITQETQVTITATSESGVYAKAILYFGEGEFREVEGVRIECSGADPSGIVDVSISGGAIPTLKAILLPDEKESKDVTWSSSDPNILAVDKSSGKMSIGPYVSSISSPTFVMVRATAGNGVFGEIRVLVGADDFDSFTFQCEDTNFLFDEWSSDSAKWLERQPQGACHSNCHLWWKNDADPDPVGSYITCKFINIFREGNFTIKAYFLHAVDFGVFDIYINDVLVASDMSFYGPLVTTLHEISNVHMTRGVNSFKAIVKQPSPDFPRVAMIGLDEFTFVKEK